MDTAILLISVLFVLFAMLSIVVSINSSIRRSEMRKRTLERLNGKPAPKEELRRHIMQPRGFMYEVDTLVDLEGAIYTTAYYLEREADGYMLISQWDYVMFEGHEEVNDISWIVATPWGTEYTFSCIQDATLFTAELLIFVADDNSSLTDEGMTWSIEQIRHAVLSTSNSEDPMVRHLSSGPIKNMPAYIIEEYKEKGVTYQRSVQLVVA